MRARPRATRRARGPSEVAPAARGGRRPHRIGWRSSSAGNGAEWIQTQQVQQPRPMAGRMSCPTAGDPERSARICEWRRPMAVAMIGVGAVVMLLGGILYWGNVSGSLITFPYAGYIVGLIGGAISAAGYR